MQSARTVTHRYDANGRLASTTYPDRNVVTNTFTPRGEVVQIGLDGHSLATYSYTPVSRLASKSLENGTTTAYSYDAAHRLEELSHRRGNVALTSFTYTLDAAGNRVSKTQSGLTGETKAYSYDAVDQLIASQSTPAGGVSSARQVSYLYDAVGNRQGVKNRDRAIGMITSITTNWAGWRSARSTEIP